MRTNQVVFEVDGTVLSSRLIDGQFPNYRQLLPDAFEHELQLAAGEITDVVRRISLLAQKNAPLRLAFAEGELTVSARTPDVGEARESLPVPFQGEPLEIGFNPEFLRDGLEAIEGGDVLLKLISPLRPGPDPGGGRQRVHLPADADPPQRVGERVRVTRLRLRNFRSYEQADVRLGEGMTVVSGRNGAGKTNLLEALYFACTGRSCRTANEREVRALRRRRRAAGAVGAGRRRRARRQRRLPARRGQASPRRRRARRAPDGLRGAAAGLGLPAGPARARVRRARRCAAATSTR